MKIGVIADTHLQSPNQKLGEVIQKHFSDVDLIVHAGDITTRDVLHAFNGKEVIAVSGNNDSGDLVKTLPEKTVVTVSGFRIGLIHGWGFPFGLGRKISSSFVDIHCIVYGHSHRAFNRYINGILYFNPGAFIGGLTSLWRPSIGILNVDREIHGQIIRI